MRSTHFKITGDHPAMRPAMRSRHCRRSRPRPCRQAARSPGLARHHRGLAAGGAGTRAMIFGIIMVF